MDHGSRAATAARFLLPSLLGFAVAACSGATAIGSSPLVPAAPASPGATGAAPATTSIIPPTRTSAPDPAAPDASADTGAVTGAGDIADNAVFLTYTGAGHAFSIEYVEGWQVTSSDTGVDIRDKDSSESVLIVPLVPDVAAWIASTDLPGLQATPGFALVGRDRVTAGSATYEHIAYHFLAPPDPVTGKQVPSTADRYYVPGPTGLAVVTLSTPDGVDNVDAFRRMIESFTWR